MTPLQFRAAARKLVAQHGAGLIVLDYAQLMAPGSRDDSRERQVAEISRTVKTTAAELGIPIIMLSQLNENGRSRESRAIEQDANIFAILEEEGGNHFLNIKLARDCARARIPLTFRREFTRFEPRFAEEVRS
jgi:replicative DNA helicase